ncbi:hypothetical protein [Caenibacillus caldisaponilyticus]|uniref:hypothetical protein n=1 Tax=Caenibacillus caldisaponilyticus TaxID=1674942 RepID=UPI001177B2C3|nr:hypothetical protein [Caenibacillus caldisaponilyticus]
MAGPGGTVLKKVLRIIVKRLLKIKRFLLDSAKKYLGECHTEKAVARVPMGIAGRLIKRANRFKKIAKDKRHKGSLNLSQ